MRGLLLCRENGAQQNQHTCGAVVLAQPCPKGEDSCPTGISRSGKSIRLPIAIGGVLGIALDLLVVGC